MRQAKFIGRQREHRVIVETVLGKPLPSTVIVHHMDNDDTNNNHSNLVVCQDQSYHMLIHRRTTAYDACGNANYRKCTYCKEWDDPVNMKISYAWTIQQEYAWHRECNREHQRAYNKRRKNDKLA